MPAYLCRFAVRAPGVLAAKLFSAAWDHSLRGRLKSARTPVSALSGPRVCLGPQPTRLARHDRSPVELPFCVPPRLVTNSERGRNVDRLCIGYAFRPRLSSRLTLRGRTFRKNPEAYGGRDSHPPFRYSCLHSHFCLVHRSSRSGFTLRQNAPLPLGAGSARAEPVASVPSLAPLRFRRSTTRPVSYYALFKGWLLLSQPPGCLGSATSFPTELGLGDLSRRSGLFPSRRWSLSPTVSLPATTPRHSEFGWVRYGLFRPSPSSALPPRRSAPGLHLNAFRGEPAISGFDWHITPTHSSSHGFATPTGSGLHAGLAALHPGHG